jgi:hypothetical protein
MARFRYPSNPEGRTPPETFFASHGGRSTYPPHHVDASGNVVQRELFAATPPEPSRPGFSIFGITFHW